MNQPVDPRLAKFQANKAARKAAAIKRKVEEERLNKIRDQIRAANPSASPTVVEQVLAEHLRHQKAEVISVQSRNGPKKVQVFRA